MIDETLLADPHRCPACAALLPPGTTACPACHLRLQGPTAGRLWAVSQEAVRLLGERARLVAVLRAEGEIPSYVATAPGPRVAAPAPAPATAGTPATAPATAGPTTVRPPAEEWTPRRVQNLLLSLGVILLGVAAVIFVAVSWGRLGVGGRAAVLTGVTALSYVAGTVAHRRGLTATAEALSLLTVGLALLDCGGARAADLLGLRAVDGLVVAAGSAALVAAAAAAGALALPTRSLRVSAAVLGQLAVPLAAAHLADGSRHPAALLAAATTAQALLALAVVVWWPGHGASRSDARPVVGAGGVLIAGLATALAVGAAHGEDGSLVVGAVLLLVLAAGAAAAGEVDGVRRVAGRAPEALRAVAAALVVVAAWAPVVDATDGRWLFPALAAVAAVLLGATALVPLDRRVAPLVVTMSAALLPVLSTLVDLVPATAGRLQWPDAAWSSGSGPARRLLDVTGPSGTIDTAWPSVALLALGAAVLVAAPVLLRRTAPGRPVAVPLVAAAAWLVPPSLDLSYPVALGADLVLAAVLLIVSTYALGSRAGTPTTTAAGWGGLATGSAVLLLALSWSFAVDVATLVVLPLAAVTATGVAALATRAPRLRLAGTTAAVTAGVLVVAEGAAVTRHADGGWPAVWSVALAVLVALAVAGSVAVTVRAPDSAYWSLTRRALAAAAGGGLLAEAAALSAWRDVAVPGQGLAVAAVGALLVAASTLPAPSRLVDLVDVRLVGATGSLLGLAAAAPDPDRLWVALLLVGVAVAVLGLRDDSRWGWLSGGLLTASSWVRLADAHVDVPEAYTVPPALLLLGFGLLRRHRDREHGTVGSWTAYSPALLLGMLPSLLRALTDAGSTRPLLLGVAALVVLAVGVARRLQAPLLIGGAVLTVVAVVQLAPYLVAVYDAVPRWVTIGLVGLALVGAGATYERRVQDLRRVARSMASMG